MAGTRRLGQRGDIQCCGPKSKSLSGSKSFSCFPDPDPDPDPDFDSDLDEEAREPILALQRVL
jgi:hypothetical protein